MSDDDTKGDDKISAAIQSLLDKKGGDSTEVIRLLLTENYGLRDDKRSLKNKISDLEKNMPAEGALILSDEDSKLFIAYKELGKLDEVKAKIDNEVKLQGELDKRDRSALFTTAAKAVGYKDSVLTDLAESKGLTIEMREIDTKDETGKTQKVPTPFVRVGEKGEFSELTLFVESNLKDYIPSLKDANADDAKGPDDGITFPSQFRSPIRKPSDKKGETKSIVAKVTGQYKTPMQRQKTD